MKVLREKGRNMYKERDREGLETKGVDFEWMREVEFLRKVVCDVPASAAAMTVKGRDRGPA